MLDDLFAASDYSWAVLAVAATVKLVAMIVRSDSAEQRRSQ